MSNEREHWSCEWHKRTFIVTFYHSSWEKETSDGEMKVIVSQNGISDQNIGFQMEIGIVSCSLLRDNPSQFKILDAFQSNTRSSVRDSQVHNISRHRLLSLWHYEVAWQVLASSQKSNLLVMEFLYSHDKLFPTSKFQQDDRKYFGNVLISILTG